MINKKVLSKTILKDENYKSVTYEYDENLYIAVSLSQDKFGNLKGLTIGKTDQCTKIRKIPHHVTAGFIEKHDKKIEITIKFETPIFLDEKSDIDELFKYYQELEDFLNVNYENLWCIK